MPYSFLQQNIGIHGDFFREKRYHLLKTYNDMIDCWIAKIVEGLMTGRSGVEWRTKASYQHGHFSWPSNCRRSNDGRGTLWFLEPTLTFAEILLSGPKRFWNTPSFYNLGSHLAGNAMFLLWIKTILKFHEISLVMSQEMELLMVKVSRGFWSLLIRRMKWSNKMTGFEIRSDRDSQVFPAVKKGSLVV